MGQVAHLRRSRSLGPAVSCALAVLLALCFADAASAATVNVCPGSPLPTVQAGVNAAAAGDTIQVCAGTFAEQVMVTKSVKLVGAGSAQTTIVLPRPVTGTQDVVTIDGTSGGVDVEISGFTIKGLAPTGECAPAGTTYLLSGIYVRNGANANIHDNVITGMRGDPLDGCQKGSGIRVGRAATPTSGTATITNNTISDYQKTGIIVDNAGSAATITGNTITGVGPTNVVAQNGMQISRGAVATVSGNRVSGEHVHGLGVHVDRAAALRFARQGGRLRQHVQRQRRRHLGRAGAAPAQRGDRGADEHHLRRQVPGSPSTARRLRC